MSFSSAEPHRYFIDCFVCSLLNIKLVFRYNQVIFQIHFPFTSHYLIQINDRDVNCCLDVYSSRISAVCFLLVLKIIFVIEIIFSNFYCSLNFLYLSVSRFSQYPYCFKLSNRLKSVTYKFHYQNRF